MGLIVGKYLPTYFSEKAKNLATREDIEEITRKVESVKQDFEAANRHLQAQLDRTVFVHRIQFETEFKALSEIWQQLSAARGLMGHLRSAWGHGDAREKVMPLTVLQERLQSFTQSGRAFIKAVHDHSPFYPENIHTALLGIIAVMNVERGEVASTGPGEPDREWFDRGTANFEDVMARSNVVSQLIRARIAELSLVDHD